MIKYLIVVSLLYNLELLIWILYKLRIVVNPTLINKVIIMLWLEVSWIRSHMNWLLVEHPFAIIRISRFVNNVREQGILLCIRVVRYTIPYLICNSPTFQIPVSVIFKSKLNTVFLYNIIKGNHCQRLNTCTFANHIDICH